MANPFAIEFEEGFIPFSIPATAQALVTEVPVGMPFPPNPNPNNCIRTSQGWGVQVKWDTSGPLGNFLAGDWVVTVYLEKMGSGEFADLLPLSVPLVATDPHSYSVNLPFGPGSVGPGAYKIAVTVTMRGPAPGNVPGPIAGVGDGPLLQFYDAP
ncbi:MAG: hypothetical protein RLZ81_2769 [Pseudomonadota bacterium]|jgi:uncharacterized protein involved in high-affinity Fe2+ transport